MVCCIVTGWKIFGRGRPFRWLLLAIAPIKPINAPRRVNQLLLSGKERMASRANFDVQVAFASRTRLELFAARAGDLYFAILRMNSGFHFFLTSYSCHYPSQSNSS